MKPRPLNFQPPKSYVEALLLREPTQAALPRIEHYSMRPTYSNNYDLLQPGYDQASRTLVHCNAIEPAAFTPGASGITAFERLPPVLRSLLRDFPFSSPADLVNLLATLLFGLLARIFAAVGKPVVIFDGNQPGTGKSTLVQIIGVVLDDHPPGIIPYSQDEEEVRKKTTALLKQESQSVIVIDNARVSGAGAIASPWLESVSTSTEYSDRVLGATEIYSCPNDLLWLITANSARVGPDLASRAVVVRLACEGDAGARRYTHSNILRYAQEHRAEILAELFGLVEHWTAAGRPRSDVRHRFQACVEIVGGILEACGFTEFLQNQAEVSAEINTRLEDLAALAEVLIRRPEPSRFFTTTATTDDLGARPGEWLPVFGDAKVLAEELAAAKTSRGKATKIGAYLSPLVDRLVRVEFAGALRTATLRSRSTTGNGKLYWFELTRSGEQVPQPPAPVNDSITPAS